MKVGKCLILNLMLKLDLKTTNLTSFTLLLRHDTEQSLLTLCSNEARYDDVDHKKKYKRMLHAFLLAVFACGSCITSSSEAS